MCLKKKYTALESNYNNTVSTSQKTRVDKETVEAKYAAIEQQVENCNSKINSLRDTNDKLTAYNDANFEITTNGIVMSNDTKKKLRGVFANVNANELAHAKT